MPPRAAAQQSPAPVQRYNRIARGANIDEWHKRLFDPDPAVRLEAVDSLGKDGTEQSVKPLLDATADVLEGGGEHRHQVDLGIDP
jgi:hypothetical protein